MSQSTADTDPSQLVRKYVGARLELNGYIARGLHGLPGMHLLGKEHKAARYIFISFRQTLPRTPFPQSYLGGEKQEEKVVNGKDTKRDYARLCDKHAHKGAQTNNSRWGNQTSTLSQHTTYMCAVYRCLCAYGVHVLSLTGWTCGYGAAAAFL